MLENNYHFLVLTFSMKLEIRKFHVVNVNKQQQRNVHIIVHVIIMLCYPKLLHLNCHSHCYHHNRC